MRHRGIHRALCLLLLTTPLAGCRQTSGNPPRSAEPSFTGATKPEQLSPNGVVALESYLDAAQLSDLQYPGFQDYRSEAKEFYAFVGNGLPWVLDRRPSPQAQAIVKVLELASEEGLNPIDYDGSRWNGRLGRINSGRAPESELIRFDLAVTVSAMRYISHLHRGRVNPREFHFDLDIKNKKIDLSKFLRQKLVDAEDATAVMRTVEPPFPAYRQTVDALRTYKKLASDDDGKALPLPPKLVKPGDAYNGVPRLKRLLSLLGDLPETKATEAPEPIYKGSLIAAVKHFQERHGLEANGIIDTHTLKEFNTPLSQRVVQLQLTLERWRWLPHEFERPPIVVNIPEFRLYMANEEYHPAFSMKVVVGRSYKHQTPVFAAELKSVIFRPYWNVPLDIQRHELLPELKENPDYLQKHSFEVVDHRGEIVSKDGVSEEIKKQLSSGKLAIRQRPGQDNSLGLVKFDLPNVYDVYMHGTPATELFTKSRRDFSHGCIRVEDPVALAAWVLRDKPEWGTDQIRGAMYGDRTIRVSLTKPISVLILYGTAIVTEAGEIHFLDDIYGLDAMLEKALAKGYPYAGID